MSHPDLPLALVLPLAGSTQALLQTAAALAAAWPEDLQGELVVPTRALTARDRALLCALEGDVRVLEGAGKTYGELAAAAARSCGGSRLLLLAEDARPTAQDLRAGDGEHLLAVDRNGLARPIVTSALDLRSVRALLAPPPPPLPAPPAAPPLPGDARVTGLLSVVVVSREAGPALRRCLEAVGQHTRRPHEVVVVAAHASVARWAAGRPRTRVVDAPGSAYDDAVSVGVAATRGEHVVLLDAGAVVHRHWADALLAPFSDPGVAGVSARCRGAAGPAGAPEARSADREGAELWRRQHRGSVRQADVLGGPCTALRAAALTGTGLLPTGLTREGNALLVLSARLRAGGGRLTLADEVLVAQEAVTRWDQVAPLALELPLLRAGLRDAGMPLLSATLIVKDEQRALAVCLASLADLVDEVVVSDTGSTDRTVEIAQQMGARVVHRPWTGDFAAARNHAHEHATGLWTIYLDADEQLVCDGESADLLLNLLLRSTADGIGAPLRHLSSTGEGHAGEHVVTRLLRRAATRWRGVVHELPVRLDGSRARVEGIEWLRVEHDGYRIEVAQDKGKGERNLALAREMHARSRTEGGAWAWKGAYELARALWRSGADDEIEPLLLEALAGVPATAPHLAADAGMRLAQLLVRNGRAPEAVDPARRAAGLLPHSARVAHTLALVLVAVDDRPGALAALQRWTPPLGYGKGEMRDLLCESIELPTLQAHLLLELGRAAEAVPLLTGVLDQTGEDFTAWGLLADALRGSGQGGALAQLAVRAPRSALARLLHLPPHELEQLRAGMRALGTDPEAHTPQAVYTEQVDAALAGHTPEAVRAAAAGLEATEPGHALALWSRLGDTPAVRVARARCLLALQEVAQAVEVLQGLDLQALGAAELLVVALVCAAAGDAASAAAVLRALPTLPPEDAPLAREAVALAAAVGANDALSAQVRALAAA